MCSLLIVDALVSQDMRLEIVSCAMIQKNTN